MTESLTTEPVGHESTEPCTCCGRSIFEGAGWLLRGDKEIANYSYRWSDGHEVAFSLAVAGTNAEHMRDGFVVVSCRQQDTDLSFSVCEPKDAPWGETQHLGSVLTREQALDPQGLYPDLWSLVDSITELEPRLADRIRSTSKH